MTCDVGLSFQDHQRTLPGPADQVLIESKTTGPAAPVDTILWRTGHRPTALSKYCVGPCSTLTYPPTVGTEHCDEGSVGHRKADSDCAWL